jgi:pyruvate kinase
LAGRATENSAGIFSRNTLTERTDQQRIETQMTWQPISPSELASAERPGSTRTKIVATIGPASKDYDSIRRLAVAGVDVFRLNFSHGTHEDHAAVWTHIQRAREEVGRSLAVLMDLSGPKIRLGTIVHGDEVLECGVDELFELKYGEAVDFDTPGVPGVKRLICPVEELFDDLEAGQKVLFADGTITMTVVEAWPNQRRAILRNMIPGRLRNRQGINLPGGGGRIKALTGKDIVDLDWAIDHPVSFIALSFVRQASDVRQLRSELEKRNISARIIAKIEKPAALANLDSILDEVDAIMVARGDLGVELDIAQVPAAQKRLISESARAGLPVITATQMLGSMEVSTIPTRAEAADVFNAVLDGTDAVMLSGETAVGRDPVLAVRTMSQIVQRAEAFAATDEKVNRRSYSGTSIRTTNWARVTPITAAMVHTVAELVRQIQPKLAVVVTRSGLAAFALSKLRLDIPIVALSDNPDAIKALALGWGVEPLPLERYGEPDENLQVALEWALERQLLEPGDRVVHLRGAIANKPGHNALYIHEVRSELLPRT